MEEKPKVLISIVVYNSASTLRDCLEAISESVHSGKAEVIVINNNSPDESLKVAGDFPWVEIIDSKENLGFAGGHNLAWKYVKNKYWLLLNPDAIFYPQGLDKLIEWMDLHPRVGAASPEILDGNGTSIIPGRRFPSIFLSFILLTKVHHLFPRDYKAKLLGGIYSTKESSEENNEWVPGTAMIVRREAVEEVGPLSEEFFMYGEDIEWCWRFHKAGWKIGVCSSSVVKHHNSTSAVTTWGEAGMQKKTLQGIYKAVKKTKGAFYAKFLFGSYFISKVLEAYNPFHTDTKRAESHDLALVYLKILKGEKN